MFNLSFLRTVMQPEKVQTIFNLCCETNRLPGNTAELGVFRGGISKLISTICCHKTHFCFDTFEGVALSDDKLDVHKNGEFACSLEEVKSYLFDCPNIEYVKGIFPDSVREGIVYALDPAFSFVHVDTDTYAGTIAAAQWFGPRMVTGGIILYDDWEWQSCPGVTKAVKEMHDNIVHIGPNQAMVRF